MDKSRDIATKPADLEGELGIAGGTLRPILKKLKDSHLLVVVDGHYRVQSANLDSIGAAIAGETSKAARKGRARKSAGTNQEKPDSQAPNPMGDAKRRKSRTASGQLKTFLTRWVNEGFFNEPKTLAKLVERYHEHGVITRQTSLSGLVLEAVRECLLARAKIEDGGKQVWGYRARSR